MNIARQDAIDMVNNRMQIFPMEEIPEKNLAADGILHRYADPSKIPFENDAWSEAAAEKHRMLMEEMNVYRDSSAIRAVFL